MVVVMETPEASLPRSGGHVSPEVPDRGAPVPLDTASSTPVTTVGAIEVPDEVLMQQYISGSNAAFDRLYARYREPLYRILARLLPRRALADEIFQEVWLRVVTHRHSWQRDTPFRPWLLRIVRNRAIDALRQARPELGGDAMELAMDVATDPSPQPDAELSRFESARRLQRALAGLPESQREAFLLRAELGLGHEQIAELTGVNAETAKSRLRYAYARLREVLSP